MPAANNDPKKLNAVYSNQKAIGRQFFLILSFNSSTMTIYNYSFPDTLAFIVILAFACWSLWKLVTEMDDENMRLKRRNATLAEWLQMAELQTGIPYYSTVALGAVPHESAARFMSVAQRRIFELPNAPCFATTPVSDTGGTRASST